MATKTLILDNHKVELKLQRMAFQIWENNSSEKEITLIGIEGSGVIINQYLAKTLGKISPLKVHEEIIKVHKKDPLKNPTNFKNNLDNKSVVLVDDVANSGKTLLYAMKPLLDYNLKKLQIAVLIDRKHKAFPITPDIIGHALSTTLQEHIEVECAGKKVNGVYLL